MSVNGDIDELLGEIDVAFARRGYPGDTNITKEAKDNPTHEANQIANFFRGSRWQDVSWRSIVTNEEIDPQGFVFLLTPEAFAYYLPAFLKESLVHEAPELTDSLLSALSCHADSDDAQRRWTQERVSLLNEREREVLDRALDRIRMRVR